MSPKRNDAVAPPSIDEEWRLVFAENSAAKGWADLGQAAPANTRRCFEQLRRDPQSRLDPGRQHRLSGRLAERSFGGRVLPQWEYEVTSSGRVRYLVDEERHTVWLVYASPAHPKDTE